MSFSKEITERAMKVDPALIGHYIEGGYMDLSIKPVDETFKVVGPAFTVQFAGRNPAMLSYAMRRAPKGSILVIDRMGDTTFACIGEGMARIAKSLNLAGIIINGPSTDTSGIKNLGLPVFSTGASPVTTARAKGEINGNYNLPVSCGGLVIRPGDIVFGDIDGVIVAPPEKFEALLEHAEKSTANEKEFFAKIETMNIRKEPLRSETDVETFLNAK